MFDDIKYIISIVLKVILWILLLIFYGYISIKVIRAFNIQDYLNDDNLALFGMVLSAILTVVTIRFCKSFFKKMQNQN